VVDKKRIVLAEVAKIVEFDQVLGQDEVAVEDEPHPVVVLSVLRPKLFKSKITTVVYGAKSC